MYVVTVPTIDNARVQLMLNNPQENIIGLFDNFNDKVFNCKQLN